MLKKTVAANSNNTVHSDLGAIAVILCEHFGQIKTFPFPNNVYASFCMTYFCVAASCQWSRWPMKCCCSKNSKLNAFQYFWLLCFRYWFTIGL